jgi:heat shock protein HslJ
MRKRVVYLMMFVAVLALFAASCGSTESTDVGSGDGSGSGDNSGSGDDSGSEGTNLDGEWVMTAGSVDGSELPSIPGYDVTLTFDGESLGGVAACNGYGGSFSIDGDSLTITDLFSTEMACIDDGVMDLEAAFLSGLSRADTIAHAEGELLITGDSVSLTFVAAEVPVSLDLVGTEWVLDSIISGDAVSSTVAGAPEAFVVFADDGSFSFETGCRTVDGGDYTIGEAGLELSFGYEQEGCDAEGPAGAAEQDEAILAVFEQQVVTYTIDVDRLTVMADNGEGVSFVARA